MMSPNKNLSIGNRKPLSTIPSEQWVIKEPYLQDFRTGEEKKNKGKNNKSLKLFLKNILNLFVIIIISFPSIFYQCNIETSLKNIDLKMNVLFYFSE